MRRGGSFSRACSGGRPWQARRFNGGRSERSRPPCAALTVDLSTLVVWFIGLNPIGIFTSMESRILLQHFIGNLESAPTFFFQFLSFSCGIKHSVLIPWDSSWHATRILCFSYSCVLRILVLALNDVRIKEINGGSTCSKWCGVSFLLVNV